MSATARRSSAVATESSSSELTRVSSCTSCVPSQERQRARDVHCRGGERCDPGQHRACDADRALPSHARDLCCARVDPVSLKRVDQLVHVERIAAGRVMARLGKLRRHLDSILECEDRGCRRDAERSRPHDPRHPLSHDPLEHGIPRRALRRPGPRPPLAHLLPPAARRDNSRSAMTRRRPNGHHRSRDKGTALSEVEREPVEPMHHLRKADLDTGSAPRLRLQPHPPPGPPHRATVELAAASARVAAVRTVDGQHQTQTAPRARSRVTAL